MDERQITTSTTQRTGPREHVLNVMDKSRTAGDNDRVDDRDRPRPPPPREALALGDMRLRWAAAGMLELSRQLRHVKGYRQLGKLSDTLSHAIESSVEPTTEASDAVA